MKILVGSLFVILLTSCSGNEMDVKRKNATMAYWNSIRQITSEEGFKVKDVDDDYDGGMAVCDAYQSMGSRIDALPILDVEPSVVDTFHEMAKNHRELAVVYRRLVEQHESWSHGLNKIFETALHGFAFGFTLGNKGDPAGVVIEDLQRSTDDNIRLEKIKGSLSNLAERVADMRIELTRKYGVEFHDFQ